MMEFRQVLSINDLWEGEMRAVKIDGWPILLIHQNGEVRAYLDKCPHQAFALSRGMKEGTRLTCAAHGWTFDVLTGQGLNPKNVSLIPFPAKIDRDMIWVKIPGKGM